MEPSFPLTCFAKPLGIQSAQIINRTQLKEDQDYIIFYPLSQNFMIIQSSYNFNSTYKTNYTLAFLSL